MNFQKELRFGKLEGVNFEYQHCWGFVEVERKCVGWPLIHLAHRSPYYNCHFFFNVSRVVWAVFLSLMYNWD